MPSAASGSTSAVTCSRPAGSVSLSALSRTCSSCGQRGDVRLDVRVDALVDQRHAGGVADEPESGSVDDAGVHGGAPFDGQAEPELWLCPKGAAVSADVAGAGAVHRAERAAERLGGAVAVPHGDVQQIAAPTTSAAATVMRRRRMYSDSGMPASDENIRRRWYSVVPSLRASAGNVDLVGEALLDQVDEPVQRSDHGLPSRSSLPGPRPHPTIAVRSDRIYTR